MSLSPSKTSGGLFGQVETIANVQPAWDRSLDALYNQYYGSKEEIESIRELQEFRHFYSQHSNPEKAKEVGRKWELGAWTDGSFIDDTFEPFVIGFNEYKIRG